MKAVVLSDTHIKSIGKELPERLKLELEDADLIIHAGDWKIPELFEELKKYGTVVGVYGNIDDGDIKELVSDKEIVEISGWRIGIVHGHGEKKTTEKRAAETFEEPVDVIIFGHSHLPLLRYVGKTMLFNPGSPTDKRRMPYYSFGILHLGKELRAEHVFFN